MSCYGHKLVNHLLWNPKFGHTIEIKKQVTKLSCGLHRPNRTRTNIRIWCLQSSRLRLKKNNSGGRRRCRHGMWPEIRFVDVVFLFALILATNRIRTCKRWFTQWNHESTYFRRLHKLFINSENWYCFVEEED